MGLMIFLFLTGISASVYFVVMSYRAIRISQMSPQLTRLHRKLTFVLILQIVIPAVILCIPMAIYQSVLYFKIMNAGTGE